MCKWRTIAGCILIVLLTTTVVYAGTIRRTYRWEFQGEEWTLSLPIPSELYRFFRDRPRVRAHYPDDHCFSIHVTDPRDDRFLGTLVRLLEHKARRAGFDEWERLHFVISFVQSLTYMYDNGCWARYPIETLVHRSGDCEDTAILAAALLCQMGYSVVLLLFDAWGEEKVGHMAIGVAVDRCIPGGWYWKVDGRRYFYLETVDEGWPIGVMPEDTPEKAVVIELTQPELEFSWRTTPTQWCHYWITYRVYVTVVNRGSGRSFATQVYAAFDAGPRLVWDDAKSRPFSLSRFSERTITLYLEVPRGEWTHLSIEVWSDNHLPITRQSGRFRT